jgi:ATP-binding protein involved in chromosome partitioning
MAEKDSGLTQVKHKIAIASGKGGVGKSTTALSFALGLKKKGFSVGLLDGDIYGPSLVHMTGVSFPDAMEGDLVCPPRQEGIPVISSAMFGAKDKAQILRGPMAGNLAKELLHRVAWGPLDYLILDYPPGTGDIQLSISQSISLSGAILVTTPQDVSLIDVVKAGQMFETLKTPILGVVETMSYFYCDGCDKKHHLYPRGQEGGGPGLARRFGAPFLGEIPFMPQLAQTSDESQGLKTLWDPYKKCVDLFLESFSPQTSEGLGSFRLTWQKS